MTIRLSYLLFITLLLFLKSPLLTQAEVPAYNKNLSLLGAPPDWSQLDIYQHTIPYDEFYRLLTHVYAPRNTWKKTIRLKQEYALILTDANDWSKAYRLNFSSKTKGNLLHQDSIYSRTPNQLPPIIITEDGVIPESPMKGARILLDPGHIGGEWAKMEERWFQMGKDQPVTEGDMVLRVCQLIQKQLEALDAEVLLTRGNATPVNRLRPKDYEELARSKLKSWGLQNPAYNYQDHFNKNRTRTIQWQSEMMFYRVGEIRQRAQLINSELKPDIALCLHFNAESWGNPNSPDLVDKNHLHFLINGCYLPYELDYNDTRFEMMRRLLSRVYSSEVKATKSISSSFVKTSELPPFRYLGHNASALTYDGYIWSRNLIANRLYQCPTIFIEPYVMNSKEVYARLQAGEYEGLKEFNGKQRKNIYQEYADAIVQGLYDYYAQNRRYLSSDNSTFIPAAKLRPGILKFNLRQEN
ncbi:MAG: hypothetical protein AAF984_07175 [Verrucomicrobiota bacterium]